MRIRKGAHSCPGSSAHSLVGVLKELDNTPVHSFTAAPHDLKQPGCGQAYPFIVMHEPQSQIVNCGAAIPCDGTQYVFGKGVDLTILILKALDNCMNSNAAPASIHCSQGPHGLERT
mmetsp:Transcript_109990/g.267436  ORF Transcript_109990/g.267436 Transcript_109990/m.267436 type:complete len:117 (-) Transcript_109990:1835-2185(-)